MLKGSGFIAQLILARLLGPEEFGLIGMIAVFVALGVTLVDSGLSSSLIRTKDADDLDSSTIFFSNFIVSLVVYGVIYFTAPLIAGFYEQNVLVPLIRVYCLGFIISSFSAIQVAILAKKMAFKRLMQLNIPGTLIGIVTGITLGYFEFGVWSIVWMYLTTQLINSSMLWGFSEWKPSLAFSFARLRKHLGFGYKILLASVLNTLFDNLYNVIIGKLYSVRALGYYERAYTLNQYPVSTLTSIVDKVTYPMLSNIQDERERVSDLYRQILQIVFFTIAPLMLGAAALAEPLFSLVLGAKWLPAVPFFQILCLSSILYPIHAFNINILKVYGRSDLYLKLEIIKKSLLAVSIVVAVQFGILTLVWSSAFVSFTALVINSYYSSHMIKYSTRSQLLDMLPTFLIALVTAILMLFLLSSFPVASEWIKIFVIGLAGMSFYITVSYLFKRPSLIHLISLVKEKRL